MAHEHIERPMSQEFDQQIMETTTASASAATTTTTATSTIVGSDNGPSFKFNAQAPEFVPRTTTTNNNHVPISGYFYPCFHYLQGGGSSGVGVSGVGSSDWFFVGDQEQTAAYLISSPSVALPNNWSKNVLTDDLKQKIIKQVEYQFSDMSLLANESLAKQVSKDPEGFVPISAIASTKKIKSLTGNIQLITQSLRSSLKLIVSDDGKKVRRRHPFTEKDKEELQSRTVVVENLPEDHSHKNLEKLFGVVGSVKTIRICHPQESNSGRAKGDFLVSNKLHALVEYEATEIAERAVQHLNDERNWRKGLRVRLLLRCSPKSVLKSRKSEFDGLFEDDDTPVEFIESSSRSNTSELVIETPTTGTEETPKKGWAKGRGKGRGVRGRGLLSPQSSIGAQCETSAKPPSSKGPRMPDGTRGFTMGRGKPLNMPSIATLVAE
ncbi:hypothetical protein ACFE04_022601 [Oxalis oulophora]